MTKHEGYCKACGQTLLKTKPECEYHRLAAQEELGESLADAVLATHDNPSGADCACMVCKLAREFKEGCK